MKTTAYHGVLKCYQPQKDRIDTPCYQTTHRESHTAICEIHLFEEKETFLKTHFKSEVLQTGI